MELVPEDEPSQTDELSGELTLESAAPLRKRHRQNLQDLSNTKPLTPIRASGRIRIKMTAVAEQKPPEPSVKSIKVLNSNVNNKCQRRRAKKLKTDLVSELAIDVKRPSSVLVDTSIRALLTNVAFSQLSPENQKILIESLPSVDRPSVSSKENQGVDLNPSSINNEFFNRACIEWRDRLSNGEFTNEHQTKLRAEHEREKSKIDPWKARNFEGIWGLKINGHPSENVGVMMEKSALEMKDRVQQGDFEIPEGFISEVWKRDEEETLDDDMEIAKMDTSEENWEDGEMNSPSPSPSQNPSVSTSVPTPPAIVTSTQLEAADSPEEISSESASSSPGTHFHQSVIAEATSSVDVSPIAIKKSPEHNYSTGDDYTNEIASNVELSNDGVPTRWFHPQEHDYLKNEIEPEPSGMDEQFEAFESEVEECASEHVNESIFNKSATSSKAMTNLGNSRINNYDTELPQEIFHVKPEKIPNSFQSSNASVLVTNFMNHQDTPVVVRQVIEPSAPRYNTTVIMQDEQSEANSYHNDSFVIEEADIEDARPYRGEELHMNVSKNVKLLAFPSNVKYNDKYIIEESPQHIHQTQQQPHTQAPTNFRSNGTTNMQPYFVGGTNFAYISKMGNKIETAEPTRIIKQEANNNQGQMKQRIIYEIATDPKVSYEQPSTHRVTYATQPHQEIFHQMVKHPNGTTTIYETSGHATKKTIIQRKKTVDPYTVQVVANNNTIILTPIGNTQQNVQQQSQKSIVHIHRTAPMMQTSAPPVQFLTAPQTFLKKQTVIHPQMINKPQPNYTTVIRAPVASPTQQQIITTVSSKIQRPIQKQKVIMSTSSLQQYRSYNNQKPSAGHGSRKQLHPQHIIRPAPTATTTNVIHQHQQITHDPKPNQVPVILPTASVSYDFQTLQKEFNKPSMSNEHVIMSAPISMNTNQIPVSPVVLGPPPGINNIYVRPKRPQQVFQPPAHSHVNNMNNVNLNNVNLTNQQIITTGPPRMRQQQSLQRPPPGSVNLERSYQICQAVIQNSPNRLQLNNQLKPPSAMGHKKF